MRKEQSGHTDEFSAVLIFNSSNFGRWDVVGERSPLAAGNGIMFLVNAQVRSRIPQVEIGNPGQV